MSSNKNNAAANHATTGSGAATSARNHHQSLTSLHHQHHHQRMPANNTAHNHDQQVRLQAGDGQILTTTVGIARLSSLLRGMFEDVNGMPRMLDNTANSTINFEEAVPLIGISSDCLRKIIEFCTKHEKDALAFLSDSERDEPAYIHAELPEWDQHFLAAMEQSDLFELILAASYLDIPLLTDYCCKFLAGLIRGKSAQQLRDMFNIRGDGTPEEEKEVMKEFGFAAKAELLADT